MNPFQSYSPRVLPLEFDSLENESGCQAISGTDVYSLKAFNELCAFEHDSQSAIFNQLKTVSYTEGPTAPAVAGTLRTTWAFWVASIGIRGGIFSSITPPANGLGNPSSLYPATVTDALSAAFDNDGLLSLAIELGESTIEVKWYTSSIGNVATASFIGYSPLLLNTGLVYSAAEDGLEDIVCLYLRAEKPFALFARFQRDNYETEYVIHDNLPRPLGRLILVEPDGFELNLYARDRSGFDLTFHSPSYAVDLGEDSSDLSVLIDAGAYVAAAVETEDLSDDGTLTCQVESGNYFDALEEAVTTPDAASLACSVAGGIYSLGE